MASYNVVAAYRWQRQALATAKIFGSGVGGDGADKRHHHQDRGGGIDGGAALVKTFSITAASFGKSDIKKTKHGAALWQTSSRTTAWHRIASASRASRATYINAGGGSRAGVSVAFARISQHAYRHSLRGKTRSVA